MTSDEVIFDTAALEPRHRFDAAYAFFDGYCTLTPLRDDEAPYDVCNTSWRFGDFVAHHAWHGPTAIAMCNDHVTQGHCAVRYFSRGSYLNVTDQNIRRLGPEILSSGVDIDGVTTEGFEFYSLEAPLSAIDANPGAGGAFWAVQVHSPAGRILLEMLMAVFEGLGGDGRQPAVVSVGQAEALFELAIHGMDVAEEAARPAFLMARGAAMQRYIDAHLDDPELGPMHLAAQFGLSRAGVFRAFEPTGGVAAAIACRRMVKAYRILSASKPRRGLVRQVAEACGYPDPAHFCRVFRRHLDLAPGAVVGFDRDERTVAADMAPASSGLVGIYG